MSMSMEGRQRQKRRSKYDNAGRDYKCQFCDNAYLSYPAMYTHMKTKHYYQQEDTENQGQPAAVVMGTGRGRGRPKKNVGRVTKLNPESDDYFKTMDKVGGPTDPLTGFEEMLVYVLKQLGHSEVDFSKHSLYEHLKKFSYEETPGNIEDNDNDKAMFKKDPALERQYLKMSEEERNRLCCDDIFAVYLRETSQKVNENFYKILLKFIISYREFANKNGWSKLENDDGDNTKTACSDLNNDDSNKENSEIRNPEEENDFCLMNNAEHIPDLCNEFITVFLEENDFGIERADAIDMTRNF